MRMRNDTPPRWVSRTDPLLLDAFVDNPYECPIVIDRDGIIRFMSRYNTREKGYIMAPEEAVGKHITEVVKKTRMPEVLKTGKAEIGKTFFIGERQRVIARTKVKPGKFELEDHGTIFLDEIGDMPLPMQAKLLRVLQEHEVERIGATRSTKLDFRVIAATNQDLGRMIKESLFRSDLFYRLNIFHIRTPSLREMPEDIPRIAYYLLSNLREKRRLIPNRISPEAMTLFKRYSWPGNVRELKNALERAMNIAEGHQISVDDLPGRIRKFYDEADGTAGPVGLLRNILADAEKRAIVEALRFTAGNKAKAARILGMHRTGLYQKLKRYDMDV